MEVDKQPGISFVGLDLLEVHFSINDKPPAEVPVGLEFTFDAQINDTERLLVGRLSCDLFGALEQEKRPPVEFRFTLAGVFKADENSPMSLTDFAQGYAPAHMVPFAREFIADITTRSPLPTLRVCPINVLALLTKKASSMRITQQKKSTTLPLPQG